VKRMQSYSLIPSRGLARAQMRSNMPRFGQPER
jgi:hypothetical protein